MYLTGRIEVAFGQGYQNILLDTATVDIDDSIETVIASCEITVPLNAIIRKEGEGQLVQLKEVSLVQGTPVRVKAWYDGYKPRTLFEGFVFQFREGTPATIICEDEGYKFRKGILNKTWASTTLKEILQYICDQTGVRLSGNVVDISFVNFYLANVSPLFALDKIKSDTGLIVTLTPEGLIATFLSESRGEYVICDTGINVIGCSIQQPKGVYKNFRIEMKYKDAQGKDQQYFYPEDDVEGELRSFDYTGTTIQTIMKSARGVLSNLQTGMFEGSITILLYPAAYPLQIATFKNRSYPSQNGNYLIKRVHTRLGAEGYRQTLTLSQLFSYAR